MTTTKFIPTNHYYHEIIAAPDAETKRALYRERFIQPWKPMMDMMGGMFPPMSDDDEFAVARGWTWVLPDELDAVPGALAKLEAADAWRIGMEALTEGAAQFDELPFDHVEGWLIAANPERADPLNRGYTGAIDWMQPRLVVQYDTPNDYNLARLPGSIVHELNHLVRMRVFPWDVANTSVADYIIHEGVAESFAAALYGADKVGYFVTEFDESELDTARQLIGEGLERTGFNTIRGYIFGDGLADKWGFEKIGMPNYGGYAVGYRVVQAYLQRTGKTASEATLTPAQEIIDESGYFA